MSQSPSNIRSRPLVFGAPAIDEAEIEEVVQCMRSGWLGTGPRVARLEEAFRAYKAAEHAVAVSSCTAALHLSLLASGVGPGDEVVTTALTFCATVNAIIHSGAKPVLVDVDPATMNLDCAQVDSRITSRTRAIIPVHFAGRPCSMAEICRVALRHRIKLIEDCAHAIEAEVDGRKTGTFGDFSCFSFYVTKNMTTVEGGMVLARRKEDADRIKVLALHGMSQDAWRRFSDPGYKHYQVVAAGFKYNMTDLQAAIGVHQLAKIEGNWRRRQVIWQRYNEAFVDLPVVLPAPAASGSRHSYHLYTLLIDPQRCGVSRDEFLEAMTRHRIGVGVHYLSIPEHRYYQEQFGWKPEDFPNAMRIGRQTVSLPLSAALTPGDVEDVIEAVRAILAP